MQLNFLQEDLLELMQQGKPAAPAVSLPKKSKSSAPAQASLPMDAPPAKTKPAIDPVAHKLVSAAPEAKAEGAFKTISEAAELLGVPAYVLRFWESQFPQISPTKSRGGRRYYRPDDMEVLATIKTLLYKQGYTIKGARKAFSQMKEDVQLAAQPVPVAVKKPIITPKQRSQLSAIRSELMSLREQLTPYLA